LRARVAAGSGPVRVVAGETTTVEVVVDVSRGFHIGSHPAEPAWGVPTEVGVSGACGAAVSVVGVEYPPPVRRGEGEGATAGYEGRGVVFRVGVTAKEGGQRGAVDLEFEVRFQACEDEVCHRPEVVRCAVQARVEGAAR